MSAKPTPIICPHCGKPSGHTREELLYIVLTEPLKCRNCGEEVIPADKKTDLQNNYYWQSGKIEISGRLR
jgi:uncharacterized Zn finger protein